MFLVDIPHMDFNEMRKKADEKTSEYYCGTTTNCVDAAVCILAAGGCTVDGYKTWPWGVGTPGILQSLFNTFLFSQKLSDRLAASCLVWCICFVISNNNGGIMWF